MIYFKQSQDAISQEIIWLCFVKCAKEKVRRNFKINKCLIVLICTVLIMLYMLYSQFVAFNYTILFSRFRPTKLEIILD